MKLIWNLSLHKEAGNQTGQCVVKLTVYVKIICSIF